MTQVATLIPVMRERGYGNNLYQFVPCYKVITPDGKELQPYMRKVATHYESSASEFCKSKGWDYVIEKN